MLIISEHTSAHIILVGYYYYAVSNVNKVSARQSQEGDLVSFGVQGVSKNCKYHNLYARDHTLDFQWLCN